LQREWFNNLHTEVYIPIFAKRKWSGLLAIGSKLSGNRYTAEDLVTLSALANQTAVALENARLVDNLMRLNNELRKARRDLETSNRTLQKMDETKSDFISIASHELRTPLTIIRGYTEMLIEDTHLDSKYRAIIKGIHEGTIRLHEVMDSMFDITQISASSHKLRIQYVDIGEIVRDVCSMQKKAIRERNQSIVANLPGLPNLQADPNLIEKLFHHLIVNAIKFTPNEGKIMVTGCMVEPNASDLPQGGVEIVVADTGLGVDPTYREIIFTKFYQPGELSKHSTSKTRFKGSGVGLGLALCKGIVEAHGGRIWVESPGHDEVNFPGSQFHIILPLTKRTESDSLKLGAAVNLSF
jgi:signal transduction histidine kinase